MSTTPNEPKEPESEQPTLEQPGVGAADAHGFAMPGGEQPQQSPYQQENPYQQQQPVGQYAGQQQSQAQYGSPGPYHAAPPPPQYGQPYGYGYPASEMPPGMPPLADWSQRATAFVLDNGLAIVAGWIAGANINRTTDTALGLVGLVGVVWAIVNAVRAGREGQSYGKRAMGIRLARLVDGQPVGAGLGFLRLFLNWLFWVACVVPGVLNLLWPLWDSKHQTWCDKIAKSVVVKTR